MRRERKFLVVLFALIAFLAFQTRDALAAGSKRRPNVVVIQVDDMSMGVMNAAIRIGGKLRPSMPNVENLLAERGTTFRRYYANDPICGPSRASLLTGLTPHNHGMLINAGPFGYPAWTEGGHQASDLPTWLDDLGYRTAHIGKYLNGYDGSAVPPGWDTWITPTDNGGAPYYNYSLNINGEVTEPIGSWTDRDSADCKVRLPSVGGSCKHSLDVQTAYAVNEVKNASKEKAPFFLELDFNAPHDDGRGAPGPQPPARVVGLERKVKVTLPDDDATGNKTKPYFIKDLAPMTEELRTQTRQRFRAEVASARGIDLSIGRVIKTLRAAGELPNTFLVFISDNGIFHGEHRIAYGKFLPHEPSTRQPLIVRGPGIRPGSVSRVPAATVDLAPTIMSLVGGRPGARVDGKSLAPFLRDPKRFKNYAVQLEGFNGRGLDDPGPFTDGGGGNRPNQALVTNYTGFVAGRWKFVHYYYGDDELYDLARDPDEYWNLAHRPEFADVIAWAQRVTSRLSACSGAACRIKVNPPARG